MQTKQMGIKGVARELGWVPWGLGSGHQGAAPDLPLEHLRARTGLELPLEQHGCALPPQVDHWASHRNGHLQRAREAWEAR